MSVCSVCMRVDFVLDPDSKEEVEVVEQLSDIRNYALFEADMSEEEFVMLLSQFQTATLDETWEPEDFSSVQYECPVCGGPVEDIVVEGIGVDPVVEPCEHETTFDELPEELFLDE